MPLSIKQKTRPRANPFERANRRMLANAQVQSVVISGGPGCGKSSLIQATAQQLGGSVRVGVITCDVTSHLDLDQRFTRCEQRTRIITGLQGVPDPLQIHEALHRLDLNRIDLLFIENIGTLVYSSPVKLGQDLTVAMFSVAAGHDKPAKHPELVASADAVILNKSDLLYAVPFDRSVYRSDVQSHNSEATQIELSALHGHGLELWTQWLRARAGRSKADSSSWFG